jgi:hypothetical protein
MKTFKISAPIGNIVVPKEVMTEQELREYAAQIATDAVWKEKAEKDEIGQVVEWLNQIGYTVTENA